jgi:hypothetical protein
MVAGPAESFSEDNAVILVKGKWDEAKVGKCLVALESETSANESTLGVEDGLTVFTSAPGAVLEGEADDGADAGGEAPAPEPPSKTYFAWLAPDTFAFAIPGTDQKALLAPLLRPTATVARNKRMMALIERIDTGDTLWGAALDGDFAFLEDNEDALRGVYANIDLGPRAVGYFGVRFNDAERTEKEAVIARDDLRQQKKNARLKAFLDDSRVFVADNDVVIEARMSETKVAELAKQLAVMNDGDWSLVLNSLEKLMEGK